MSAKLTVLIIDDEPDIIMYLLILMEDLGFRVISASDADEGLKLACSEKPDLICLDVMMPRRSGVALYKELKTTDATKDIPTMIISAVESAYSFRGEAFRKIVQDDAVPEPAAFFEKPVDIPRFKTFLNSLFPDFIKDAG